MDSMRKVFEKYPYYKVIVVHSELALGPLKVAKEKNIPVRICFSHNNQNKINLKRFFLEYEKYFLKKYCTDMFAVSELAARYTFGNGVVEDNKVQLVKNGIIIKDFTFSLEKRISKRKELKLEDKCIIGHIGRFMEQKNHMFLIDVFKELLRSRKDVHLILVGEGRLENKIREKINTLGIKDNVTILGRRMDIGDLMKAMDFFVFPSFYEGFGNVIMEAQAASLPILMTSDISDEVIFSEYVHKMSLDEDAKKWAKKIDNVLKETVVRKDMSEIVSSAGFNILNTAKWYENYYLNLHKNI